MQGAPGVGPVGTIVAFAGKQPPSDWLECDGSAVEKTVYADLYAVIGATWGTGNGATTFNLPDLRGRFALGDGQSNGLSNRELAAAGGAETHKLTVAEMPAHTHKGSGVGSGTGSGTCSGTTEGQGPGVPVQNLQGSYNTYSSVGGDTWGAYTWWYFNNVHSHNVNIGVNVNVDVAVDFTTDSSGLGRITPSCRPMLW